MLSSDPIEFLYGLRWYGAKLGLTNTFKLAALAGDPQKDLRFIHAAGTNGKGSTCAMLESIYRAAGLRVGLFTSPHLVAFGERIQVNRRPLPKAELARLVNEMRSLLKEGWGEPESPVPAAHPPALSLEKPGSETPTEAKDRPTFFEVVTVMALRYFAEHQCDLVIWETGLGGRLDATNIVTPLASVITNIQYDHQQWLGETLASIAAEKAGVIKPGIPIITGVQRTEALEVIERTARERGAPLIRVRPEDTHRPPLDAIRLPLLGQHQRMNAAVALATVRAVAPHVPVAEHAIHSGLAHVRWAGRLQLVTQPSGRRILLDGAHNIGGAESFATALRDHFPGTKPALVLGILRDKDWPGMCELLAPMASRILLVPVHSERTAEPHGLAEVCHRANPGVRVDEFASLHAALEAAERDAFVAVAGSLYLIGEAMELLHVSPVKATGERSLNEWGGARGLKG